MSTKPINLAFDDPRNLEMRNGQSIVNIEYRPTDYGDYPYRAYREDGTFEDYTAEGVFWVSPSTRMATMHSKDLVRKTITPTEANLKRIQASIDAIAKKLDLVHEAVQK